MSQEKRQVRANVGLGLDRFSVHLLIRREKRPDQPGPNRSLMIGGVAFAGAALVMGHIPAVSRIQRAESEGGQQTFFDRRDNSGGPVRRDAFKRQADSKYLIGPQRFVAIFSINDIVEIP